jgi:uncharacterized protein YqeY
MKLIEQIRADRIVAFKAKENIKKDVLGCLISESCKIDKEPEDNHVLSIIKKFIEGANEVKENAKPGDYPYYKADIEIEVLSVYRPHQLTEDEIRAVVLCVSAQFCGEERSATMKDVMAYLKDQYLNQYDGSLASKIAKEML